MGSSVLMVGTNHGTGRGIAKLHAISTFVSVSVESRRRSFMPDSVKNGGAAHGTSEVEGKSKVESNDGQGRKRDCGAPRAAEEGGTRPRAPPGRACKSPAATRLRLLHRQMPVQRNGRSVRRGLPGHLHGRHLQGQGRRAP